MRRTILALTALATSISPATAEERVVLEPGSKWKASYDAGLCRLARMFTADGQQHALVFEQAAPEARFNMSGRTGRRAIRQSSRRPIPNSAQWCS
jgi:hypothetical protein